MFSPMIQNLISSSGHQAAMQRAIQLRSYLDAPKVQQVELPKELEKKSFAEVLKTSEAQKTDKTGFGNLISRVQSADVKAKILGNSNVTTPNTTAKTETKTEVSNKFGSLTGIKAEKISKPAVTKPNKSIEIPEISKNAPKSQILSMIDKVARKHGVDEKLVRALVRQESGFNPKATSHCGAMGLMQLMPSTAKGLGVKDAYNPVQNVEGGVKYLKSMLNRYNGNVILALAAYNAGPGAVDKYDGVPPYKETQNYVKNILANYL